MLFLHELNILKPELLSQLEATVKIENKPYMTFAVENIGRGPAASLPCP